MPLFTWERDTKFIYSENLKDYHRYENYKLSYAARRELGGGATLSSIHEIDMMLDLFGNAKLLKSHHDNLSPLKLDVEDFSLSFYKNFFFKRKVISLVILDFFQVNKERYIKIVCDNGEIFLDLKNYFLKIIKKNKIKTYNFIKNRNLMYINELKLFLNFFIKRKKIPDQYNEKNAFKSLKLVLEIKKKFQLQKN